ncbi:VWA domain-containing protein [Lignipirellula cremea]|uniref:von Willebrand factor type A domain protein n=1 Tax=Lignipirellula cremea TaxID=2528010 RepID=A0A518DR10_9BACT|nr:VWA domain-containing protein [Lignipirellula cremea]QDU94280.1 von Willebrand factor type A domain protein [Lignipirellula cremea]
MLAALEFSYPLHLWALAAAPLVAWLAWRSPRAMSTSVRATLAACRTLLAVLLILALAGPHWRSPAVDGTIVLAIDRSPSAAAGDTAALAGLTTPASETSADIPPAIVRTGFAGTAWTETNAPGATTGTKPVEPDSRPGPAVAAALAMLPGDQNGKVVLATDGLQTSGDLLSLAVQSRQPIDTALLSAFALPEAAVLDITAPASARPLSPVPLQITVIANRPGQAQIRLSRNGQQLAELPLTLGPEPTSVFHLDQMPLTDDAVYTAELIGAEDQEPANNRRRTVVAAAPPQRALLVSGEAMAETASAASLSQGWATQGLATETASVEQLAAGLSLDAYDLLFLSGVAAARLPEEQWQAIEKFVQSGGGLLVAGGESVFGREALTGSPLEQLAPVDAAPPIERRETVLAMALVIDKSASMEEERRMQLAKSGAKRVVELLGPEDKVGLLAFGSESQWVSPIATLDDKASVLARIDRLQSEGRTNMYPALARAYLALEQTDADQRHVILLTDGVSTPGDFGQIARKMAASGIGVSTVSVSQGADQTILRDIARIAGGVHRHCDKPEDLGDIVVEAAAEAAAVTEASDFQPYILQSLPGLELTAAPPLAGYARTRPKADGESLLLTPAGDPLLSWRRLGAGTVIAFTADLNGPATARFRNWDGYPAFWLRLARLGARSDLQSGVACSLYGDPDQLRLNVEAITSGVKVSSFRDDLQGVALLRGQTDQGEIVEQEMPLAQVAPGRYEARWPHPAPGVYTAQVELTGWDNVPLQMRCGSAVDYPRELRLAAASTDLLAAVAAASGGVYQPDLKRLGEVPQGSATRLCSLAPWLLLLGAIVLLGETACRRGSNLLPG